MPIPLQPTDTLMSVRRVSHAYEVGGVVLDDVTLHVRERQLTGIVGPSGSGKTTLLRVLLGSIAPLHGTVHRRAGLRVGYVPQVEAVNWSFPITVHEAVLMARPARRFRPWTTKDELAIVDGILDRLGIGALGSRHIRELSGGQQQRVFIARALIGSPDLLLMDEPTSGIDVRTRHEVLHLLEDLNREGLAIVLTTHDLNGMAAHLPHLVCLNTTVQGEGPPSEVLTSEILERTYGAPMEVLQHAGMPLVIDGGHGLRLVPPISPPSAEAAR